MLTGMTYEEEQALILRIMNVEDALIRLTGQIERILDVIDTANVSIALLSKALADRLDP